MVNVRNGGRTALSAATHSVILLALVAGLGGVVQYIPLAVLSGILILTAFSMFDWESMRKVHVSPRGDVAVTFTTMIITVLVDLTVAVAVGVVLALIVHAIQSRQYKASIVHDDTDTYRIKGPLSFLSVDRVFSALRNGRSNLSLSLEDVNYMDISGAKALLTLIDHSHKSGVELDIKELPPHIEDRLIALANVEQLDKVKTVIGRRQ